MRLNGYVMHRWLSRLGVSLLVISWLLAGWPAVPFLNFPRRIEETKAAVANGVIVAWPSTAGSIPSRWSRVVALDVTYVRGVPNASTDPGATGGATTHQHTTSAHNHTISHTHATNTSSGPTGSANVATTGTPDAADTAHTHATNAIAATVDNSVTTAPSSGATSNDPANLAVIWIQSDGTPTGIPNGALAMFNSASLPTNWTIYANSQDRFLKGAVAAGDGGGMGGAATHNHTGEGSHTHASDHVHPDGTTANGANVSNSQAAGTLAATDTHNHSYTVSSGNFGTSEAATLNTSTDNHEPSWQKLAIIENGTGGQDLPVGTIAIWRGTLANIPEGWVLADGNSGTPNLLGDFVKGVANTGEIGNTGGATSHTHTGTDHTHTWASTAHTHTVNITGTPSATVGVAGAQARASATHTHTATSGAASAITAGNAAPSLDAATHLPPYEEVAYIQWQGVPEPSFVQNHYRWYVNPSGSENVTDPWSANDGVELAEDTAITPLPFVYDPPSSSQQIRLRVNITVNTVAISGNTKYFKLQFRTGTDSDCSTGSWTDVGAPGGGEAWVYTSETGVTDDTTLTVARLTGTDRLETYSRVKPANTPTGTSVTGEDIEFDFHIVGGTAFSGATRYLFRVVETIIDGSGITPLGTYTNCAILHTEPGTTNQMRHGNFFSGESEKGFFWTD